MKRYWRYVTKSVFWFLVVITCMALLYRLENGSRQTELAGKDTYLSRNAAFTRGNIHVNIETGYQEKVRHGRNMQLTAEVRNTGGDFSGVFRAVISSSDQEKTYEKIIEVEGKKSQTIRMYIPVGTEDSTLDITLLQGRSQTLYSGEIRLDHDQDEDRTYIGVCCDNEDQMKYLEGTNTDVTYLNREELPVDVRGLDWLDIFIATNTDLQTLKEEQIRALINWVRSGGTLVLADSGEAREISPFRGKLFEWRKTEITDIYTNLGVNRRDVGRVRKMVLKEAEASKRQEVKDFLRNNLSDELYEKWKKEINRLDESSDCIRQDGEVYQYLSSQFSSTMLKDFLSLHLTKMERYAVLQKISIKKIHRELQELDIEGSSVILETKGKKPIFQEKAIGLGKLIVSGVSLQLPSQYWEVQGNCVKTTVLDHRADRKTAAENVQKEKTEAGIINSGLRVTDWNKLPNLKLYMVYLGIYILLIGPVAAHFIRKSKRRRMMIWGIVPVSALVFSLLIYLTGTSTRLEGQCINYLNQIEMDEKGVGLLTSHFRVMNDQAGQYDLAMDGGPLLDYGNITENTEKQIRQEMTMRQGEGKTTFCLGKVPCFQGINLQSKTTVRLEGNVEVKISIVDMQLLGSVKNKFAYSLEDCAVYHRGVLYYLGDISGKEVRTIEEINRVTGEYVDGENTYEKFANKLFGRMSKHKMTPERIRRRWSLLEACIKSTDNSDTVFYGFLPKGQEITGWYDTQKAKQQNMLGGIEQISGVRSGETGVMMKLSGDIRSEKTTGEAHRILRGGDG